MSARILTIDCENSPALADVWQLYDVNVSLNQLRETSKVICWAARWYGEKKTMFMSDFHDGHDAMIAGAWALLDEADAVITYNGKRHDTPHFNREFILAGAAPPSPYIEIDLYQVIRSRFKFQSGKLAHVGEELLIGSKMAHEGHELWQKCMAGDAKAWGTMARYNKQDIVLTEALYERLLPWIPQSKHPNLQLFGGAPDSCPKCGLGPFVKNGTRATAVGLYQKFRCTQCGSALTGGRAVERVEVRGI